ncbi:MAG: M28 family metallopeptidase [Solirubrobacteraceae bacterium]
MTVPALAAFFDPTSLGALRRAPGSARTHRLDAFTDTHAVLERLASDGVRLGVIGRDEAPGSQLGPLLEQAGLADLIAADLVLNGGEDYPHRFLRAAEVAGHAEDPSGCVFIAEDRDARSNALGSGLSVAPHPRLAAAALRLARLRYIRVEVPAEHVAQDWRETMLDLELVPLHVVGHQGAVVYAVATAAATAQLDDLGFQVYRLGAEDEPLTTEVYVLRDDRQTRTGFLFLDGESAPRFGADAEARRILASTRQGLYVAVVAGRSVENYHFMEARHGHTEKLLPDPSLLRTFGGTRVPAWVAPPPQDPALSEDERRALAQITPERMGADIARYAGDQPLDDSGSRVASRHIFHADNSVALRALAGELEAIGDGDLRVGLHPFTHEGRSLQNVEAELPGAELDELVLVTAHLDSTAAFSEGYDPPHDPAPGADDDASGTVGVLAIARAVCALGRLRSPRRTIRFVLFNAEEHGLVGSKTYARDQAALGAPIVAVFQMDMIGYNREPPPTFEVHAGFLPSDDIQQRSLVLAERVGRAAAAVSPELPSPQIYLSRSAQERDPAEGRSDHASFQLVGYAACATSEDFFAGPGSDHRAEPNPNYHRSSDTFVDFDYAANLTRAVGAAAWLTANL